MKRLLFLAAFLFLARPAHADPCAPYVFQSLCTLGAPTCSTCVDAYNYGTTGITGHCNEFVTSIPHDSDLAWCPYPYDVGDTVRAGSNAFAWFCDSSTYPNSVNQPGVPGPKKPGDSISYEPCYNFAHFPGFRTLRVTTGETKTLPFWAQSMIIRGGWLPDPPACVLGTTPWVWNPLGTQGDNGRAEYTARFGTARLSGSRPDGTTGAPCLATIPGTSTVVTVVYDPPIR